MESTRIYTPGAQSSSEYVYAICRMFRALADPTKVRGLPNQKFGVSVEQNAVEPDLHKFLFRTHDDIEIELRIDFRALSREYIDDLVAGVQDKIQRKRKERADAQFPDNIVTRAVSEALH